MLVNQVTDAQYLHAGSYLCLDGVAVATCFLLLVPGLPA